MRRKVQISVYGQPFGLDIEIVPKADGFLAKAHNADLPNAFARTRAGAAGKVIAAMLRRTAEVFDKDPEFITDRGAHFEFWQEGADEVHACPDCGGSGRYHDGVVDKWCLCPLGQRMMSDSRKRAEW